MTLDILITNGRIVDGSGNPFFWGSVGIKDGKIVAVGKLDGVQANICIDAQHKVVAPGFIDAHTHSDISFIVDPTAQSKIRQGVTTEVSGNCGTGLGGPILGAAKDRFAENFLRFGVRPEDIGATWTSFEGYIDALRRRGGTTNTCGLVGHGTLRASVMGYADRPPTKEEMSKMKALLAENLDQGAMGFSTGLFYVPGSYSKTDEVVELVKVVANRDKLYASHIRDEGRDNVGYEFAWEELLETGRKTGARILSNHIKCLGPEVWGHAEKIIGYLEQARNEGVNMVADQYPYTACGGGITGLLMPRWAQEGGREQMLRRLDEPVTSERLIKEMLDTITKLGGPEKLQIRAYAPNPEFEGLLLSEVCEITKKTPIDQVVEMARKGNASLVSHILNEDDMLAFARHPAVTAGSDGSSLHVEGPLSKGHPHPRDFGTFPRAFRLFHREHKLYSLEEAVRKLTSMPAQAVGLKKRGLLREGMWADVIVFDPEKLTDTATYKQPKQLAEGIDWAIVNGVSVIAEARFLGNTPGRPITSQDE